MYMKAQTNKLETPEAQAERVFTEMWTKKVVDHKHDEGSEEVEPSLIDILYKEQNISYEFLQALIKKNIELHSNINLYPTNATQSLFDKNEKEYEQKIQSKAAQYIGNIIGFALGLSLLPSDNEHKFDNLKNMSFKMQLKPQDIIHGFKTFPVCIWPTPTSLASICNKAPELSQEAEDTKESIEKMRRDRAINNAKLGTWETLCLFFGIEIASAKQKIDDQYEAEEQATLDLLKTKIDNQLPQEQMQQQKEQFTQIQTILEQDQGKAEFTFNPNSAHRFQSQGLQSGNINK